MAVETCNGWSNRETWSLMLWVNNDEGLQDAAVEAVRGAAWAERWYSLSVGSRQADALREWAETMFTRAGYVETFGGPWPDALADIASEIGSLDRVDWRECVDSLADSLA